MENKTLHFNDINGNSHILILGDSLEIMKKYDLNAHITITSPPYNLGKNGFIDKNKDMSIEEQEKLIKKYHDNSDIIENYNDFLNQLVKLSLTNSEHLFLNIQENSKNKKEIHQMLNDNINKLGDTIIWNKENGIPNGFNKKVMTLVWEYIFVFNRKGNRAVGTRDFRGDVKNIINLPGNQGNEYSKIHKAMFPVHLVDYLITTYSNEKDTILDPFGGLGTTTISAVKNNRGSIYIEKDELYFNETIKRIEHEFDIKINKEV